MRIVLMVVLLSASLAAQQRFEVASVRENTSPASGAFTFGGGSFTLAPSIRFVAIPLNSIISLAYVENLREALTHQFRLDFSKVNAGLLEKKFDIETRGEGNQLAMLRTLLQERFGLRTHTEVREGVQYVLTTRKDGLKATDVNCAEQAQVRQKEQKPPPRSPECIATHRSGFRVMRFAGPMEEFIRREISPVVQAPVVDRTGVQGNRAFELAIRPVKEEGDVIPALTDALADLGLKLERTRGLVEVIVIDEVRMPTPN